LKSKKLIRAEEIANTISHGIGIALAVAGVTLLTVFGAIYGNVWHIISFAVFGVSMIILYLASTLYHSAKKPRLKIKLNKFDHSAIYILIAGSYTPISLISLRGWIGWSIFGLIWTLAIAGIVFKVWFYRSKWRSLSAWLYIAMGWLVLLAIVPVIQRVPNTSLWFLLAGGLSYTAGAVFYLFPKVPFFHLVFHVFILGGSVCHFFAFLYLLPI
jgi:hemolysin III